jgi:uncharacterized membrane protein
MDGWLGVLFGWVLFAGSHLLLSSRAVRGALIARVGAQPFRGLYSLVAFATLFVLASRYADSKHSGPLLWNLAGVPGVRGLSVALTALFATLAVASLFQPKPTDMLPSAQKRAVGLARITRHPLFACLGLVACSHLLVNGFLSDVVFFAGFPLFALVGGAHMDARKRREDPEGLRAYFEETSLLPFGAIAAGRNRLVLAELPRLGIAVGAAVTASLYWFHGDLFGP